MKPAVRVGIAVLVTLSFLAACRPGYYEFYEQTDRVLTVPAPGADFTPLASYGLWPEVIDLSDLAEDPIDIDHERVDPALLEAIEQNMDTLGWTRGVG